MKKAEGKYVKVGAITEKGAVALARELFTEAAEANKLWAEGEKLRAEANKLWAEGEKLWAEGCKLWAEGCKLRAEANKLWAEGDKLRAEANKLWAEGEKLRAEVAIKHSAYIPDWRAINLIAADRDDAVYCFVFNRKELWVYGGENCPDSETVEKIDLGGER